MYIDEKQIKQEVELQTYLKRLMLEDKQKQINKIRSNETSSIQTTQNTEPEAHEDLSRKTNSDPETFAIKQNLPEVLADNKEKELISNIDSEFEKRINELDRLFSENDTRRQKREIPDYLCGKNDIQSSYHSFLQLPLINYE